MTKEDIKKNIQKNVVGKIIPAHTDAGHFYKFKDTPAKNAVHSVTTKICLEKPHLSIWAAKLAAKNIIDRVKNSDNEFLYDVFEEEQATRQASLIHISERDNAGNMGTKAHNIIEKYINTWIKTDKRPESIFSFIKDNEDPRVISACRSAELFFNENNVEPIVAEVIVGDQKYSAGTVDLICLLDEKLTILDWKTKNFIMTNDFNIILQLSAYATFFEKMTNLKVQKSVAIHLDKQKQAYKIFEVQNLKKAYSMFRRISLIYDKMLDSSMELKTNVKKYIL
jgi:ATP-dependent exoDNAse (exonuclease V) beta subunit